MPEIHLPRLIDHLVRTWFVAGVRQKQDFQDLRIIRIGTVPWKSAPNPVNPKIR